MKKLVVVGPGGIGGTIAALLARTGACEVTVIGRPGTHINVIRENGLRLTGLKEFTVHIDATDDAESIRECDILIYAVRAQDTQAALAMTAHIHVNEFVASLQNGVLKDEILAGVFGRGRVVGALAVVGGERPTPGVVKWTLDAGTLFGELNSQSSHRVNGIVDIFQCAGLNTQASNEIVSATWSKMVGWTPAGLLGALSRQNNAGVFSNRLLAAEYVGMVRELTALAAVKGISLIDFGPFHIETWCRGDAKEAVEKVLASSLASSQSTNSALQAIQKGQTTEFRACLGPLIEDAKQRAIPMTRVQLLYSTLMGLEDTLQQS